MSVDGLKIDMMMANFQKSGRRGTIHFERATLESEAGGFSVTTASATDVTVFVVPSMKAFHIKTLMVTNFNATAFNLQLFASDGGGKERLSIIVPAVDTLALGAGATGDLQGLIFGQSYSTGAVYARAVSASTGVQIFAGGQVRPQDNT